jgi:hypothetical protein
MYYEETMSVAEAWVPKWEARQQRVPANRPRAIPAGGGIVLAAVVGLFLWPLIILATVSLVKAI